MTKQRKVGHSRIGPAFRLRPKVLDVSEPIRPDQHRVGAQPYSDHWLLPDRTRALSRTIVRRIGHDLGSYVVGNPNRLPGALCS